MKIDKLLNIDLISNKLLCGPNSGGEIRIKTCAQYLWSLYKWIMFRSEHMTNHTLEAIVLPDLSNQYSLDSLKKF